ncbi:MAG: IS66 family transposase, partial [bacterium]
MLQQENIHLKLRIEELEKEKAQLQAQIKFLSQKLFGMRSEKTAHKSPSATKPSDDTSTREIKFQSVSPKRRGARKGHQGHGRKIPKNLRVIERVHELPPDQRYCKICGKSFRELAISDDSNEVDYEEEIVLIKHCRKKYEKTCSCPGPKIIATPQPPKLIPKGGFSTNFLVKVLMDKYLFQIPLNRQAYRIRLSGLFIWRSTLTGAIRAVSNYLVPLYEALADESRQAHHWHADETRWRVFIEKEGKKSYLWWLWVFASEHVIFYTIDPSRSGRVPRNHLGDDASGILNADRYSAYKTLDQNIQVAYCWSYVRRDFIGIQTRYPDHKQLYQWAGQWIERINELFAINRLRLQSLDAPVEFERHQTQLIEALDAIKTDSQKDYPHWEQNKAMKSLREHWSGLTIFVHYPQVPMDNNQAERCLRLPVVGRNNYYGNHSESGGLLTAVMFTILQTCVHNQLKPDAY